MDRHFTARDSESISGQSICVSIERIVEERPHTFCDTNVLEMEVGQHTSISSMQWMNEARGGFHFRLPKPEASVRGITRSSFLSAYEPEIQSSVYRHKKKNVPRTLSDRLNLLLLLKYTPTMKSTISISCVCRRRDRTNHALSISVSDQGRG